MNKTTNNLRDDKLKLLRNLPDDKLIKILGGKVNGTI